MGRLGRLLSYVYGKVLDDSVGDIKFDPGGGANITAPHAEPANQTSQPIPNDITVAMPVPGEGREVVVAFIDPKNPQDIAPGEHKTYARDSDGVIKCQVHLQNDGTITISNDSGSFEMQAGGNVVINGVTIDTAGNISGANDIDADGTVTAPNGDFSTSLLAGGKELVNHMHAINSGSSAPGPTGPNL